MVSCFLLLISVYSSHMIEKKPPLISDTRSRMTWFAMMAIISFWISCELYLSSFLSNHFKRRGWSFPLSLSNWIKFDSSSIGITLHSLSLPGKILQTFNDFDEAYTVRLHCLFCCITGHFPHMSASSWKICFILNGYFVAFRYLMLLESRQRLFLVWKPFRNKTDLLLEARSFDFAFCCMQMKHNTELRALLIIV